MYYNLKGSFLQKGQKISLGKNTWTIDKVDVTTSLVTFTNGKQIPISLVEKYIVNGAPATNEIVKGDRKKVEERRSSEEVLRLKLGKLRRDFNKIEQLYEKETTLLRNISTLSTYEGQYGQAFRELDLMINNYPQLATIQKRREYLNLVEQRIKDLSPSLQWPPRKTETEIYAYALVNEMFSRKFQERISSAIEGGFVSSEGDFVKRTVKEAIATGAIKDKEQFIKSINRYITHFNRTTDNSERLEHFKEYKGGKRNVNTNFAYLKKSAIK